MSKSKQKSSKPRVAFSASEMKQIKAWVKNPESSLKALSEQMNRTASGIRYQADKLKTKTKNPAPIVAKSSEITIPSAIAVLKKNGYKIQKAVVTYEEV